MYQQLLDEIKHELKSTWETFNDDSAYEDLEFQVYFKYISHGYSSPEEFLQAYIVGKYYVYHNIMF